ncbi:MAG: arsenic resistance N-acetyltransferase ArsN2 [Candidatus Hodarchaeales archaeon]
MTLESVEIHPALKQDMDKSKELLLSVNLPLDGLEDQFENFLVLQSETDIIGLVGLEIYGDVGLLRSFAVKPSYQGKGLGKKLLDKLLEKSRELDLKEVFLLTDTAEEYFLKQGFTLVDRQEAPDGIKQSVEFSQICTSSPFMKKILN